jgi:amino acid transporter
MSEKGEDQPLIPKRRQRNVTVVGLVAITYFAVAGGPEGTETLIQTGGPLYSVIGFIVIGLLWSIPMALMSAELTTAFPENGGYVLWVSSAFGPQAGEMAGWLQFVSSGVDVCIYPGLFLVYLEEVMERSFHDEEVVEWSIKITFIVVMLLLNLCGIESVGHGSTLFMICLLSPFIIIVFIAFTGAFTGTTILGWPFSTESMLGKPPEGEADWPAFLMVRGAWLFCMLFGTLFEIFLTCSRTYSSYFRCCSGIWATGKVLVFARARWRMSAASFQGPS